MSGGVTRVLATTHRVHVQTTGSDAPASHHASLPLQLLNCHAPCSNSKWKQQEAWTRARARQAR